MNTPEITPWWRWPENKRRGMVPWFVIVRRCIFMPTFFVALCIGWISIFGAYGLDDANRFWRDAT